MSSVSSARRLVSARSVVRTLRRPKRTRLGWLSWPFFLFFSPPRFPMLHRDARWAPISASRWPEALPLFVPARRLPAAVEAAQAEMKVVESKWHNRMELPMKEVRRTPPFTLPRAHLEKRPLHGCPASGARRAGHVCPSFRPTSCLLLIAPLPHPLASSQVGTAALFTTEVYAWFVVGEIIGRGGSLTGY